MPGKLLRTREMQNNRGGGSRGWGEICGGIYARRSLLKRLFSDQTAKKDLGKQVKVENISERMLRIRARCGLEPQLKKVFWVGVIYKASKHQQYSSATPCLQNSPS